MNISNLFKGDQRTALIKKNIAGSFIIKGWSCIIQFLIVPLSFDCLTDYEYGLWFTINAILIGIDAIDAGLGNGLRNRLAESLAIGDRYKARQQVSTTFFMLILIITPVIVGLTVLVYTTDCYALLNVNKELIPNLNGILATALALTGSTFILKFIGSMYLGLQLPAINNLLVVLGQTVSLIGLFIVSLWGKSNLMSITIIFTASPLIVYLVSYPLSFCGKYKYLAPSFSTFDKSSFRSLFSLGMVFFVIQISGLLLFMISNVIISNVLTPKEVAPYQVAYRYYSILFMIFTIVATPFWSATTDAYTKGDWTWIKNTVRKMNYLIAACGLIVIIMTIFSSTFYRLWIGDAVNIRLTLSFFMGLYNFMLIASNCYSNILFGIGKIRMIAISTILTVIVFLPLEYIACKQYGVNALLIVLAVSAMCTFIVNYIQYKKLSTNTAFGIWNK